ncbi:MAG: PDZ domain-containing protein [Nakamurella multipartita]
MSWFTRLSTRGRTLVVGGATSAVLLTAAVAIPIPYVAISPGVTYNVLGSVGDTQVITFTGDDVPAGADAARSGEGNLNMTTISISDGITLFESLGLWASGRFALAPREDYFPPDQTVEQVEAQNAQAFRDSQSAAEIAALRYLDYPNVVYVGDIAEGSPSSGVLQPQDKIVGLDGTPITDFASLQAALAGTTPGQTVTVTVTGRSVDRRPLRSNPSVGTQGKGIGAVQSSRRRPSISPSRWERIGGPSAGLMVFTGLIDRLGGQDLTGGNFIAGTGTIDADGNVGPIGGILFKMIAAREVGATVPGAGRQLREALTQVPDGLQLVKVATLTDGATTALATLREGGTPPPLWAARRAARQRGQPWSSKVSSSASSRLGARSTLHQRQLRPRPGRAPAAGRPGVRIAARRRPVTSVRSGCSAAWAAAAGSSDRASWVRWAERPRSPGPGRSRSRCPARTPGPGRGPRPGRAAGPGRWWGVDGGVQLPGQRRLGGQQILGADQREQLHRPVPPGGGDEFLDLGQRGGQVTVLTHSDDLRTWGVHS